jgi:hypothetical protein
MNYEEYENEERDTPSYYSVIPANVRYCEALSASAKLMYGEISALSNTKGYCYANNRYFAELYKIKRIQTISDWVSQLQKLGFISVELIYKDNQISKRIIKIIDHCVIEKTPNEKTQEVQRKNVVPYNEKTLYPTTKKRKDNNTSINTVESNKLLSTNNQEEARKIEIFEEKTNFENSEIFASFDEKCKAQELHQVLKIKKRFSEQKLAEKIFEFGESDFWAMVSQVDAHLANNKKAKYSDLPAVLTKWFGTADENAAKNALNNFWRAKFGFEYESITNWSKAQKTAIKSIALKVRESVAAKSKVDVSAITTKQLREAVEKFFGALPAKWADVKWFKLETIASSFSAIMAAIAENTATQKAAKQQAQAQEEQPKEKTFGEKCADILQGVTPAVAADVAQRLAQSSRFNFTKDINGKALKALSAMVEWAKQSDTAIGNDADSLFDLVDDFYTHIKNSKK